jgi:hypothetical protein
MNYENVYETFMTLSMPTIFAYAIILFLFCLGTHILIWRTCRPVKQITSLFFIFGILPLVCALIYGVVALIDLKPIDWIYIFFLYYAFAVVYIQTYPPIQAGAPSLQIVRMIGKSGHPLSFNKIQSVMNEKIMIFQSLQDLKEQNFIRIDSKNEHFILLTKGKILADVFIYYRRLLGLEEGEG